MSNGDGESRIERVERDLGSLTNKVISLSDLVTATNTNVENLITQVGGVSHKINQPTNFNLLLGVLSLVILVATLAFTPLYKANEETSTFHQTVIDHMIAQAKEEGSIKAKLEILLEENKK